jgi:phage virion morphogenesis protein
MAGAFIALQVEDKAVQSALAQLGEKAENTLPVMDAIGASLVVSTQMRFENETGPDGVKWPASIRARVEGGKTLRDEGHLYASITHRASPSSVEVGSNEIYAAIHQIGGTIKAKEAKSLRFRIGDVWVSKESVTIPARPFLGIDDGDREMIVETVADALGLDIAGAGQ